MTEIRRRLYVFYECAIAGLIMSIAGAILYYPMSWGMMDDGQNLGYIRFHWANLSFMEVMRTYSTINYFRPVYTLFVYIGYHLFLNNPKGFYFFNFLFILSALLPWTWLIRRHAIEGHRKLLTILFCFFLLAATPLYNLVVYLSLQEKFVIFFGGWSILAFDRLLENPNSRHGWALQSAAFISFLLAMWAKPTAIAFAPWIIFALAVAARMKPIRRWVSVVFWIGCTGILAHIYLRRKDDYSVRYSFNAHVLLSHLLALPKIEWICFLLGAAFTAAIAIRQWFQPRTTSFYLPAQLMWPICLISYLFVLVPWGIATYLWAPAMVLASGCLVLLIDQILGFLKDSALNPAPIILACAGVAAFFVVARVAIPRLARQSEIGQTVQWLSTHLPDEKPEVFVMEPCLEATWNLQYQSGSKEAFHYLPIGAEVSLDRPHAWLVTRDECPIDAAHAAKFNRVVFELPHWTIYSTDSAQH